ncbi:unnamed protein product [Ilex paraguariensis]|uniref:Uncharacterized protein n=1 Tax=Ilex paraguariensis TaxID=185542 RepID=A0ABC8UQ16_9AQUA
MELIQNAEDNEYVPGVRPTLEFVFTTTDVTGTGSPATLLVFNNEVGFTKANIDSLCSIGQSTKKNKRRQGFIGEKGWSPLLPKANNGGYKVAIVLHALVSTATGFFFLSCLATFDVWPLTLPALARDP